MLCTNLKFELWLIWHTEQKTVSQSSKGLDRRMRTLRLCHPKDPKHLDGHFPFDGVDRAVEYARSIDPEMAGGRVGPDPSSAMPLLVDLIRRG